ncbi:MAG: tRNA (adenine(22)-N(1))-methyltransferase TrmK [Vulcanimicrobiota bacterium]
MDDKDWLEHKLDERLLRVAAAIHSRVHADIGTDHALLPRYLLASQRVERVIAVEKHPGPLARARRELAAWTAEVREGDGLEPLQAGEVDSLSLTGMGARLIASILAAHPDRVPELVVVQPNDGAHWLRSWGLASGYHLRHEELVQGRWLYEVLVLRRDTTPDPAYDGLDPEVAQRFGPHLLRRQDPLLAERLRRQQALFADLVTHDPAVAVKHERVSRALSYFE